MIVPSMGLGSILPAGPWTIQKMTNDLLSLHGYIAQLNDAIQASSADQGFKDRWGVFATEWNSFKDNAASYAGVWSSSDTLAKVKDYQARAECQRHAPELEPHVARGEDHPRRARRRGNRGRCVRGFDVRRGATACVGALKVV
jgi:hypothetical protein